MKKLLALCFAALLSASCALAQVGLTGGPGLVTPWTPALQFNGAAVGMTFSTQVGKCYLQLKQAVCYFNLVLSALGSSTGSATITGLPWTSDAALGGDARLIFYSGMSGMSAQNSFVGVSSTSVSLNFGGATGLTAMTNANFSGSANIFGVVTYLTQ